MKKINISDMNKSSSYLYQFSWEDWDNQFVVVLYRADRRFVVKRYVERVLANSPHWQKLAKSAFPNVEPIARAYPMTDEEVKLMHNIFSWHFNGTLTFPIIAGLDQVLEWEDVLDFIHRAEQIVKNQPHDGMSTRNSPAMIPTIPIGISCSGSWMKKPDDKPKNPTPLKAHKRAAQKTDHSISHQQGSTDENALPSSVKNYWVQINNICVPYIIKSDQRRFLPYEVLVDCDLFNEQEQAFLLHLTEKANSHDIEMFEKTISSSSSISFKLNDNLLLLNLVHLIFGMSKIVYIKLISNPRDVNKSYKTVLAHAGGIITFQSHSLPFITLGKFDFVLFDLVIPILQPPSRTNTALRRRTVLAQSHEIDYLRLIEFYQQIDVKISNPSQEHLLLNINELRKYVNENDFTIDQSLTQYQQTEYRKLRKQLEAMENKSTKKPTKRKATTTMTELHNAIADHPY